MAPLALVALAVMPARAAQLPDDAAAAGAPCVSCLVIGIDAAVLESAPPLAPGSLEGVQLLVTADAQNAKAADLVRSASSTGASVALLISPPDKARPSDEVVVRPSDEFTELRAANPDLRIVIDATLSRLLCKRAEGMIPYVDVVIGSDMGTGLPRVSNPRSRRSDSRASPYTSGASGFFSRRASELARACMRLFLAAEPMLVEVDRHEASDRW
jgi:hypothetical protein